MTDLRSILQALLSKHVHLLQLQEGGNYERCVTTSALFCMTILSASRLTDRLTTTSLQQSPTAAADARRAPMAAFPRLPA